jgi:uncharacterized integral membrane protein
VRRFTQSPSYLRVRAFTGALFVAFGLAIIVRTLVVVHVDMRAVPALVMGLALVALGGLRVRDYVRWRGFGA